MTKAVGLAVLSLLLLPSAASAATADADIKVRQGTEFGPVTFKAAKNEVNRVTVTYDGGTLVFHDDNNPVKAKGDCKQAGRNTARCPFTEDLAEVKLGNRDDRATTTELVKVFGGSGDDALRGSKGYDYLAGDSGNDTLHGLGNSDELTGGTGRDRVFGGAGDDQLFDGETDGQSARDLYRGGSSRDTEFGADRGDILDYSMRKRALEIDLGAGRTNTNDQILGLESIVGGSGDDELKGDSDDNWLQGEGGNDRLTGRHGDDIPQGGPGDDRVKGSDGNDTVWGDAGEDDLDGGTGDDFMISNDGQDEGVDCGPGNDDVRNNSSDTLNDCELSTRGNLYVKIQPAIEDATATFEVACQRLGGCSGSIAIASLDGADYGNGEFSNLPDDPQTFTDVVVQLTPAGVSALQEGAVAQVTYGSDGGYRARIGG